MAPPRRRADDLEQAVVGRLIGQVKLPVTILFSQPNPFEVCMRALVPFKTHAFFIMFLGRLVHIVHGLCTETQKTAHKIFCAENQTPCGPTCCRRDTGRKSLRDRGEYVGIRRPLLRVSQSQIAPKNARYAESSTLAIHSGAELGQDPALEDLAAREVEGALDADLAELSLGQRLSAMNGADAEIKGSESDNDEEPGASSKPDKQLDSPNIVPAHSLTRTLIQALHSSDSRLLETCLTHSDTTLIRNTVRRLPPQLSLPLLLACMERLGRGARAANMKGGGGGASSQRGTVLITWIKTTLTVHSSHLMTVRLNCPHLLSFKDLTNSRCQTWSPGWPASMLLSQRDWHYMKVCCL